MNALEKSEKIIDDMIAEQGVFVENLEEVDDRLDPDFMAMVAPLDRLKIYQAASRSDHEVLELVIGSYEHALEM